MSKKALIFSGSPRKRGNSDLLSDEFIRGANESGNETEKIFLRDKKVNYCTGCMVCLYSKKPCPQKDDMADILDKIIASDVIVMATPVYFYTMDAQMKTLIDRCCSRSTEITGKEFYFIMTAHDSEKSATNGTLEGFRYFLSCLTNPIEKGTVHGIGLYDIGDVKGSKLMEVSYEMGKNI